jgi:hypothetical protein
VIILAIVGSTKLSPAQEVKVNSLIEEAIEKYHPFAIISGGADGVDSLAEWVAQRHELPCIVCKPAKQSWLFFRPRNLLIAEICTRLVRIVRADSTTYGSGWTRDRAAEMGKPTEEHVV